MKNFQPVGQPKNLLPLSWFWGAKSH